MKGRPAGQQELDWKKIIRRKKTLLFANKYTVCALLWLT